MKEETKKAPSNRIILWVILGVLAVLVICNATGLLTFNLDGSTEESTNDVSQQSRVFVTRDDKTYFSDVGWAIYVAQFEDSDIDDTDCSKDSESCDYWQYLAERFEVDVADIKEVLYCPGSTELDSEQIVMYSEFRNELMPLAKAIDDELHECVDNNATDDWSECTKASYASEEILLGDMLSKYALKFEIEESEMEAIYTRGTSYLSSQVSKWMDEGLEGDDISVKRQELADAWVLTDTNF